MCLTKQWTRLVLSGDSHALERTGMTKASSCMPAQTMTSDRAAPAVVRGNLRDPVPAAQPKAQPLGAV
jgi:hypothetical protein